MKKDIRKDRNEALVGLFVIMGFVLLSLLVFFVSGVYFFRSGYSLYVKYDFVSVLDQGAPVRMAGVRVGEVSNVHLLVPDGANPTRVVVKLFIERGVEIRENYLLRIRGTHILSEPHIEITPQSGEASILADGSVIEGVAPVPMESLIDKANEISSQLESVLEVVHRALQDKETGAALKSIILQLSRLTESLNLVLSDSEEDLKRSMGGLRSSTESLSNILKNIEEGNGTVGKLLTEEALYEDIKAFVAEVKEHPWRLLKKDKN